MHSIYSDVLLLTGVFRRFCLLKSFWPRRFTSLDLFTSCVCFVIIFSIGTVNLTVGNEDEEDEYKEFESRKNISLYYNLRHMVKNVYTDEMFERHQSHFLFIKYEKECLKEEHKHTPNETRKPFIEIECNNNTVRKILLKKLSERIGALVLDDPAECLEEVERAYEDEDHPLNGAFRTLSIYANAYQATIRWHDVPVIVSRYWSQKIAYYINKAYKNLPLPVQDSPIYDYPNDLIMPDVAFSVTYQNVTGVSNDDVRRMQEIMEKINGPLLFPVDTCFSPESMIDYMIYKMTEMARGSDVNETQVEQISDRATA